MMRGVMVAAAGRGAGGGADGESGAGIGIATSIWTRAVTSVLAPPPVNSPSEGTEGLSSGLRCRWDTSKTRRCAAGCAVCDVSAGQARGEQLAHR